MTSAPLSPEEKSIIEDMFGRGFTGGQVARRLKRSRSTIWSHCIMHGLVEVKRHHRTGNYVRGNRLVHPFTAAEQDFIVAARVAGNTIAATARLTSEKFGIHRSSNSIRYRLAALACIEDAE